MNLLEYWNSLLNEGEITESTPIYLLNSKGKTIAYYDGKNSIDEKYNTYTIEHCLVWNRDDNGIAQLVELYTA